MNQLYFLYKSTNFIGWMHKEMKIAILYVFKV